MILRSIHLRQFKNYPDSRVELCPGINCFAGRNGSGKTNLLEAVYYLSFTKSVFGSHDHQNIQLGQNWMSVEGRYLKREEEEIIRMSVNDGERKRMEVNGSEVRKYAGHIGRFPLVMISPNDLMLITEGTEERRKFLDGMIAQSDPAYLNCLLAYSKVIEERNTQLRIFASENRVDELLLSSFDEQICLYAPEIYDKRKKFLEIFLPEFRSLYQQISESAEEVEVIYNSGLHEASMRELLQTSKYADLSSQRTTKGIHRDDLTFICGTFPLKRSGSQGQQKSFLIALKLAQYAFLKAATGLTPLLLLDDIFEKLDRERLQHLHSLIASHAFGQILITDTQIERMREVFSDMPGVEVNYFMVEKGNIISASTIP